MERDHISTIFDVELNELRQSILVMGGKVELMIANSVKSLVDRDTPLAERTIALDHEINAAEVSIDERCLELLALRQPAARDLRFITIALKIVTDLERMGDQCANIAKRVRELNEDPPLKPYIDIPRMAQKTEEMLRGALDAFVKRDVDAARKIIAQDDVVDNLYDQVFRELLTYMAADPQTINRATRLIWVAHNLERSADRVTNICERTIFVITGKVEEDGVSKY